MNQSDKLPKYLKYTLSTNYLKPLFCLAFNTSGFWKQVEDRQCKMKATMTVYGLIPVSYWAAWLTYGLLLCALPTVLYSLLLKPRVERTITWVENPTV